MAICLQFSKGNGLKQLTLKIATRSEEKMKKQINKEDINDLTNTYGMQGCWYCGCLYDAKATYHLCKALGNRVLAPREE